jgi:Amt family ammonium transporter
MVDSGDTAWIMMSTALVLLMTPGLAFFYGGLVRGKNAAATIMQSFVMLGVAGVVWVLWGYSLAFGPDLGGFGFIGNLEWFGLRNVGPEPGPYADTIPHLTFMSFQMMFAVITPALILGAFAERARFRTFLVFMVLWLTIVYAPMAHWVWGQNGWIGNELKALDFAGGTVVHINAGAAAVAAAIFYGKRKGVGRETTPHNVTMVVLGTALLWFGWFGFNAGSALAADGSAANAFVTTNTAAAMGALTWMFLSWRHTGKPSIVGTATGAVIGLVAITPAAGFIGEWPDLDGYANAFPALIIGALASIAGFYAVRMRHRFGLDDTLDVAAVHGIGGIVGALLVGVFAVSTFAGVNGLIEGSFDLLWRQLFAVLVCIAWSLTLTSGILWVLDKKMGLRVSEDAELAGLDISEHEERAYQFD